MQKSLAIVLFFLLISNAFGASQAENQEHARKVQSKLKSTSGPVEVQLPDGKAVGFPSDFQEDTFSLLNPITGESRRIYYVSVGEVRPIKCLCQKSEEVLSKLNNQYRIVDVELIDSTKLKGRVTELASDSFVFQDPKTTQSQTIKYANVKKLNTHDPTKRILTIVVISAAAVVSAILLVFWAQD